MLVLTWQCFVIYPHQHSLSMLSWSLLSFFSFLLLISSPLFTLWKRAPKTLDTRSFWSQFVDHHHVLLKFVALHNCDYVVTVHHTHSPLSLLHMPSSSWDLNCCNNRTVMLLFFSSTHTHTHPHTVCLWCPSPVGPVSYISLSNCLCPTLPLHSTPPRHSLAFFT